MAFSSVHHKTGRDIATLNLTVHTKGSMQPQRLLQGWSPVCVCVDLFSTVVGIVSLSARRPRVEPQPGAGTIVLAVCRFSCVHQGFLWVRGSSEVNPPASALLRDKPGVALR